MRVLLALVVVLVFVQGLGVLALHDHSSVVPGHLHQYERHGDGHVGHAGDAAEVLDGEAGHGELSTSAAPGLPFAAGAALRLGPLLAWGVLVALMALASRALGVWWPPPDRPRVGLRVTQAAVLQV